MNQINNTKKHSICVQPFLQTFVICNVSFLKKVILQHPVKHLKNLKAALILIWGPFKFFFLTFKIPPPPHVIFGVISPTPYPNHMGAMIFFLFFISYQQSLLVNYQ